MCGANNLLQFTYFLILPILSEAYPTTLTKRKGGSGGGGGRISGSYRGGGGGGGGDGEESEEAKKRKTIIVCSVLGAIVGIAVLAVATPLLYKRWKRDNGWKRRSGKRKVIEEDEKGLISGAVETRGEREKGSVFGERLSFSDFRSPSPALKSDEGRKSQA